MAALASAGRANQRRRTRNDLLQAAARLMEEGRKPSLEEVAEAALVSRATAYRYFPSVEALLIEAALDIAAPSLANLFAGANGQAGGDPVARVQRVDDAFDEMMARNEAGVRLMLAQSMEGLASGNKGDVPVRQNRRTPLIEAALEPARGAFDPAALDLLVPALGMVIGTEGMVALRDVLQLDEKTARKVRRWAIRALVEAARKPDGRG